MGCGSMRKGLPTSSNGHRDDVSEGPESFTGKRQVSYLSLGVGA